MDPNLSDYISKARASGMSDEQIKQSLIQSGWQSQQIDQYFQGVANTFFQSLPFTPPQKSHKRVVILASILVLVFSIAGLLGWKYFFNYSKYEVKTFANAKQGEDYANGEIIVKLKKGITKDNLPTDLKAIFDKEGITSIEQMYPEEKDGSLSQYYLLKLSPNVSLLPIIHKIQRSVNVQSAEPSFNLNLSFIPNDTYYHSQGSWKQNYDDLWNLKIIQMEKAWDITQGDENLVVGIIDTGLDINHPEISGKIIGSKNINEKYGENVSDCQGHGTHVAGIIAAKGDNNEGIIGVAPKVKIMPISFGKVCDKPDTQEQTQFTKFLGKIFKKIPGFEQQVLEPDYVKSIVYASTRHIPVVNISSAMQWHSQLLDDAMEKLVNSGSVVVVPSGNEGKAFSGGLTSNPKVIVVGASDRFDNIVNFSNFGFRVDVVAPGGNDDDPIGTILSLKSSLTPTTEHASRYYINGKEDIGKFGYKRNDGTSQAAPHVAGLVALLKSLHPDWNSEEIKCAIIAGVDKPAGMKGKFHDDKYGYGRINAYKTLQISNPTTNCRAQAVISSPDTNSGVLIGTKVNVQGLASSQSFNRFLLEYASSNDQNNWKIIRISSNPQTQDGLLGEWDTISLKEGSYILRLTVKSSQDTDISATKEVYLYKQNGETDQTSDNENSETNPTSTETTTPSGSPVSNIASQQSFLLWFDKDQTDITFSCNINDFNCNLTSGKISGYAQSLKGKIKRLEYTILASSSYLSPDYDNTQYKTLFDSLQDQNPASFSFNIPSISLGKALDGIATIRFRITDNQGNIEQVVFKTMSVGKNGIAIQLHKNPTSGRVEKNYPNSQLICRDGSQNCDQKGINFIGFYCDEEQKRRCAKEIIVNLSSEPLPVVSSSIFSLVSPTLSLAPSSSKTSSNTFTIWFDENQTKFIKTGSDEPLTAINIVGFARANKGKLKKLEYTLKTFQQSICTGKCPKPEDKDYKVLFDNIQSQNPVSFNFGINISDFYSYRIFSIRVIFRLTDDQGNQSVIDYENGKNVLYSYNDAVYKYYEFKCSESGNFCKKNF